jgi:hypothetical protein
LQINKRKLNQQMMGAPLFKSALTNQKRNKKNPKYCFISKFKSVRFELRTGGASGSVDTLSTSSEASKKKQQFPQLPVPYTISHLQPPFFLTEISPNTPRGHLRAYLKGGIEALKELNFCI